MESPNPYVDRLVQAMSPSLAEEFERILSDLSRSMEAEFQARLQSAIEETKERASEKAAYELQLAVDEAREAVRTQVTQEQQQQFEEMRATLDSRYTEAVTQFEKDKAAWAAEGQSLQRQRDEWKCFAQTYQQLTDSASQAEILVRWLKIAEPFAESIALYTSKADGLALWKSRGSAAFPEIVSRETIDPETYFRTVQVRDRTVAAVCAVGASRASALDFLVDALEFAVELFGSRLRTSTSRSGAVETARSR